MTLGSNLVALEGVGDVLSPIAILVLCAVAGIGTVLLLPGRRTINLHRLGGAILLMAGLVFAGLIIRLEIGSGGAIERLYFWLFSAIAIYSAVRVVTHPRPVYSALYFVLTVFASAGLFVLLKAEFMAAALVLIYAGAILITYVFVIMLASQASNDATPTAAAAMTEYDTVSREPLAAAAVGFGLAFVLLFVIFDRANHILPAGVSPIISNRIAAATPEDVERPADSPVVVSGATQELGMYLFRSQVAQMDLAGLMLSIAMVGAIVISRRQVLVSSGGPSGGSSAETVVGPATPVDDNPHSIPVFGTDNPRQKAYPQT